jgi:tRNA(fMet)-specific endonuclease VapC
MTLYVLDSDHVSLHQCKIKPSPSIWASSYRVKVSVTIVAVEEQLRGWLALIRRAETRERLISAYASLHRTVAYFAEVNILDCGEVAASHLAALRAQKVRIGTHDLRIAAISLAANAILVTRNPKAIFVKFPT